MYTEKTFLRRKLKTKKINGDQAPYSNIRDIVSMCCHRVNIIISANEAIRNTREKDKGMKYPIEI